MLADIATSDHIPPNNPPNPNSIIDTTTTVDGAEHLGESENEEMPPLEDIDWLKLKMCEEKWLTSLLKVCVIVNLHCS